MDWKMAQENEDEEKWKGRCGKIIYYLHYLFYFLISFVGILFNKE